MNTLNTTANATVKDTVLMSTILATAAILFTLGTIDSLTGDDAVATAKAAPAAQTAAASTQPPDVPSVIVVAPRQTRYA